MFRNTLKQWGNVSLAVVAMASRYIARPFTLVLGLMLMALPMAAAGITVAVSPTTVTLNQGATQQFTAAVTGTNFTGATAVKFNGTAASSFTVVAAPTITSFTPTSGPAGTTITLTGTNFTGASAVKFNGTAASSFTVVNATSITAVAPTGATTGKLTVTTAGGTATSSNSFTVVAAPTISSFTPASGSVGSTVTLTGTNFTGATAVKFNGTAASSFSVVNATTITAVAPTGVTTGKLTVIAPGGTATSSGSFTAVALPVASNLTASTTTPLFGATVTLTPTFSNGTGTIGTTGAGSRDITASATSGTATAPTPAIKATTTFTLTVTNAAGIQATKTVAVTPRTVALGVVSPVAPSVTVSTVTAFTVNAGGGATNKLNWTATGGTFSAAQTATGVATNWTAPATPGAYTVTATSADDITKSVSTTVTVVAVPVATITAPTSVAAGQTGLIASVPAQAGSTYTWSTVNGGSIAAGGTSNVATFTAGTGTTMTLRCIVKNAAGTSAVGNLAVSIIKITLTPSSTTLEPGQSTQFTGTVSGSASTTLNWSVVQVGGGTITSDGIYVAPATFGTYTVQAQLASTPSVVATATVTVEDPNAVQFTVTPTQLTLATGAKGTFTVQVTGTSNPSLMLPTGLNGSISMSRSGATTTFTYTAPGYSNLDELSIVSVSHPSRSVMVRCYADTSGAPTISSFTATPGSALAKQPVTIAWSVTGATQLQLQDPQGNYTDVTGQTSLVITPDPAPSSAVWYTLWATNGTGQNFRKIVVPVTYPVITSFTSDKNQIHSGDTIQLSALYSGGTGTVLPSVGAITSGTPKAVIPTGRTQYTLTVANAFGGTSTATTYVDMAAPGKLVATGQPTGVMDILPIVTGLDDGRVLLTAAYPDHNSIFAANAFHQIYDPASHQFTTVTAGGTGMPGLIGQSVTQLRTGKVLVAGGMDFNGGTVPVLQGYVRLYVFDPLTYQSDVHLASTPDPSMGATWNHSATRLLDGRVLLVGGTYTYPGAFPDNTYTNPYAELYDPEFVPPTWDRYHFLNPVARPAQPRTNHGALLLADGRVLVGGGSYVTAGSQTDLNSFEIFDPVANTWKTLVSVSANPGFKSLILLPDGKVLIEGKEVLDPVADTIQAAMAPNPGFDPATVLGPTRTQATYAWTQAIWSTGLVGNGFLPDGRILYGDTTKMGTWNPMTGQASGLETVQYPAEFYGIRVPLVDGTVLLTGAYTGKYDQTGVSRSLIQKAVLFDPQDSFSPNPSFTTGNVGNSIALQVTGTPSGTLTWTSSFGSVDAQGRFKADHTGVAWVTATDGSGRKSSAQITVFPSVKVTIQGARSYTANLGSPLLLSAKVSNHPSQVVLWTIDEGTAVGSLSPEGVFWPNQLGTFHIRATSFADPNQSDVVTVTVNPPIQISVDKPSITLTQNQVGATIVTVTVQNNTGFGWYTDQPLSPAPTSNLNILSVPTPSAPGNWIITVYALSDPAKTAQIHLNVLPLTGLLPLPAHSAVEVGKTQTLALLPISSLGVAPGAVFGSNQVVWSSSQGQLTPVTYGQSQAVTLTAPSTPGKVTVTATWADNTNIVATFLVDVVPTGGLSPSNTPIWRAGTSVLTRLLDGRVLIVGGSTNQAELYDPSNQTFRTLTAKLASMRNGLSTLLLPSGKVLILGGVTNAQAVMAELFDPLTETFTPTTGQPSVVRYDSISLVPLPNGKVLVSGSGIEVNELFDPSTGTFSAGPAFASPRTYAALLPLQDGKVLAVGGTQPNTANYLNALEVLDEQSGLFRPLFNFPGQWRLPFASQTPSGKILVLSSNGGQSNSIDLTSGSVDIAPSPVVPNGLATMTTQADGEVLSLTTSYSSVQNIGRRIQRLAVNGSQFDAWGDTIGGLDSAKDSVAIELADARVLVLGTLVSGYSPSGVWVGGTPAGALIQPVAGVAVDIQPKAAKVFSGKQWVFRSTARGLSSSAVTWSVQEGAAGGSVSTQGVYTAPATPGVYHLIATSTADGTTQGSATITVDTQRPTVTLIPAAPKVAPGGSIQLTGTVNGASDATLTWSATGGTIAADGTFTAPATTGTYLITAQSAATPGAVGTAYVQVIDLPIIQDFHATPSILYPGASTRLTWTTTNASAVTIDQGLGAQAVNGTSGLLSPTVDTTYTLTAVNGAGQSVATLTVPVSLDSVAITLSSAQTNLTTGQSIQLGYTVNIGGVNFSTNGGVVSPTGLFMAPHQPGTYTVKATSTLDPTKVASVVFTVTPINLTLSPSILTIQTNQSAALTWGSSAGQVSWTVVEPNGGTIDSTGQYHSPSSPGTYTVVMRSLLDPLTQVSATVVVQAPPPPKQVLVTPSSAQVVVGDALAFTAQASGLPDQGVVWSVVDSQGKSTRNASIVRGLFTATVPGNYLVVAKSDADSTISGTATVQVVAAAIVPSKSTLGVGNNQLFIPQNFPKDSNGLTPVKWAASGGSITQSGVYTAPSSPGYFSVTATSLIDASRQAVAYVTVVNLVVKVIPANQNLPIGGTFPFQVSISATAPGLDSKVAWRVQEGVSGGTVDASGNYQAPATPGIYHVLAQSLAVPTQVGVATISVGGGGTGSGDPGDGSTGSIPVGIRLEPAQISIPAGNAQAFSAILSGTELADVTWAIQGNPSPYTATLESGTFVASKPGVYIVTATSVADPRAIATATVTVQSSFATGDGSALPANLRGYSVTMLKDGRILIAGGSPTVDPFHYYVASARPDAFLYDPKTQKLTPTGSMTQARSGHKATLLADGRVLMSSGLSMFPNTPWYCPWDPGASTQEVQWCEVYDPVSGTFRELNLLEYWGPNVGTGQPAITHGGEYFNGYYLSDVIALPNGDAFIAPGTYPGSDFGSPWKANWALFQGSLNQVYDCDWKVGTDGPFTDSFKDQPRAGSSVLLNDGRVLTTGGIDTQPLTLAEWWASTHAPAPGWILGAWNIAWTWSPSTKTSQAIAPMNFSRTRHSITKLEDGRILVIGGATGPSVDPSGVASQTGDWSDIPMNDTPTAEIFDPATGSWTVVGGLNESRQGHAALLLPDGTVLVVGGRHFIGGSLAAPQYSYPHTIEIFDPQKNTFHVLETLSYGLDEPKLVLLQDWSVFYTGTICDVQSSGLSAGSKQQGNLLMRLNSTAVNANAPGNSLGKINVSYIRQALPEEAALESSYKAYATTDADGSVVPSRARISIPLPGQPQAVKPTNWLPIGVNELQRYFILKLHVPQILSSNPGLTNYYQVVGITVQAQVGDGPGAPNEFVLGNQNLSTGQVTWQALADGVFNQVHQRSDIPDVETGDGLVRERVRKAWLTNYLQPPPAISQSPWTEYYRVRVTPGLDNPSWWISYGMGTFPNAYPPVGNLQYIFNVYYMVNGVLQDKPWVIHSSPIARVVPHWSAAQYFQTNFYDSTYPNWNNDKWCAKPLLDWVINNPNVLGPVNDISLEHGRNTGHGAEHLRGDSMDVYHPGFLALCDTNGTGTPVELGWASDTTANHIVRGSTFMDTKIRGLVTRALDSSNPANQSAAKVDLARWIHQARLDLTELLNAKDANVSGLYLMTTPTSGGDWFYANVRNLIWNGKYSGLDLTNIEVPLRDGSTRLLGSWLPGSYEIKEQQLNKIQPDPEGGHNDHMHIRPIGKLTEY
jgi:hypothetical protein